MKVDFTKFKVNEKYLFFQLHVILFLKRIYKGGETCFPTFLGDAPTLLPLGQVLKILQFNKISPGQLNKFPQTGLNLYYLYTNERGAGGKLLLSQLPC